MNLAYLGRRAARLWPDRIAVIDGNRTVSFGELNDRAARLASVLLARGLKPGARVALLVGNQLEWFDATFGLLEAGLVRTYLNPRLSGPELSDQIADSGATVLIVGAEYAARIEDIDSDCLQHTLTTGPEYEKLLAAAPRLARPVDLPDEHPAEIRYSSGTSGSPKGAVVAHSAWRAYTYANLHHMETRGDEVLLHVGPMGHASGACCYPMMAAGARQVLHRGFDPLEMLEAVPRHGITTMLLVPTMIYMLLELTDERTIDVSSLRTVLYGTAPMSPDRLQQGLDLFGSVFQQIYGQTEALGPTTFLAKEDHVPGSPQLASCGRESVAAQIRIVDDSGEDVAQGAVGEILTRGPMNMSRYWNQPEKTAATLDAQGWLRTGDMARMDELGYVYLIDRKSDLIISGGYNVYPLEVENALLGCADVLETAVIGVPDDKWGEAVLAVVRVRPGSAQTEDALRASIRPQLAGYKVPKTIQFVTDDLPRGPTGKLLRRRIRDGYGATENR